ADDPPAAGGRELVALGMAAEILGIVEDQYARAGAEALAEQEGGRESADARTDDDKVVVLAGRRRVARLVPEILVADRVHDLEIGVGLALQPGERWRVGPRRLRIARTRAQGMAERRGTGGK